MFKSSEIKAIQNQQSVMLQQRNNRADACFQTGMQALLQAHEQGFRDPLPGRQACAAFIEAIRHKTADIRGHLMLAYLFAVYGDFNMSAQYLKAGNAVDPSNPELAHFRRQLLAMQAGDSIPAVEASPDTIQDQEYQSLEMRLRNRLQSLERQGVPSYSADPTVLAQMEESSQRFHVGQQRFAVQIETLAADFDTGSLDKLLAQLDVLWQKHEAVLRGSKVLTLLKDQIQQTQFKVTQLLRRCSTARQTAEVQQLEAELEGLLDMCDTITRAIEALVSRKIPLQEVEAVYQNLMAQAEAFREMLDEAQANVTGGSDA